MCEHVDSGKHCGVCDAFDVIAEYSLPACSYVQLQVQSRFLCTQHKGYIYSAIASASSVFFRTNKVRFCSVVLWRSNACIYYGRIAYLLVLLPDLTLLIY